MHWRLQLKAGISSPWYERAYQEDASHQSVALAYAKSLLAKGQVGAAALFSAEVAEAAVRSEFDPVDVVTEVINRVEHALGQAMSQGLGQVAALGPTALAAGAVA